MPIPAILGALSAIQGVYGVGQKISAEIKRNEAEKNFTPYQIPSSINTMLDKANSLASQTEIPGADIYRSQARSNAAQTVENAQRTAGSSSDVLGALNGAQDNLDSFYQNIAAKGAGYYQQNQAQLQNALQTFGGYETERWRQNEYLPYIQAMTNANAVGSGGNANIGSAINSGLAIGGAKWEMDNANTQYNDWKNKRGYGDGVSGTQKAANDIFDPNINYFGSSPIGR